MLSINNLKQIKIKMNISKFSFFILFLFTISSCVKIPQIQNGGEVKEIHETNVILDDGRLMKMVKEGAVETTTIVLVRHAEKMKDQKDPDLTNDGNLRASKLKDLLSTIPLNQIYSTDYNRTFQTATPTSNAQGVEITSYNPRELNDFGNMLLQTQKGKNILVVGHSNTTPKLLNFFMKETVVESILESDYGNLYIVNIDSKGKAKAMLLKF